MSKQDDYLEQFKPVPGLRNTGSDRLRAASEAMLTGEYPESADHLINPATAALLRAVGTVRDDGWWTPNIDSCVLCCPVNDPCTMHAAAMDLADIILGETDV